jgi:hypothetical protein
VRRFIDSLRELLLPALALTILATLWVLAKARNSEADLNHGLASRTPVALLEQAAKAEAAGDADATAQADPAPADHR